MSLTQAYHACLGRPWDRRRLEIPRSDGSTRAWTQIDGRPSLTPKKPAGPCTKTRVSFHFRVRRRFSYAQRRAPPDEKADFISASSRLGDLLTPCAAAMGLRKAYVLLWCRGCSHGDSGTRCNEHGRPSGHGITVQKAASSVTALALYIEGGLRVRTWRDGTNEWLIGCKLW